MPAPAAHASAAPIWRRAVSFSFRAWEWVVVVVASVALLAAARTAPPLVVDVVGETTFRSAVDAIAPNAPPSERLDLRASLDEIAGVAVRPAGTDHVAEAVQLVDAVTEAVTGLPGYGDPVVALTAIQYQLDRFAPTPVVRKGGREAAAVLHARAGGLASVVPVDESAAGSSSGSAERSGLWLPASAAGAIGATAGDVVELTLSYPAGVTPTHRPGVATATVAGVYRDDAEHQVPVDAPDGPVRWNAIESDLPDRPGHPGVPGSIALADTATFLRLAIAMDDHIFGTWDAHLAPPVTRERARAVALATAQLADRVRLPGDQIGRLTERVGIDPVRFASGLGGLVSDADATTAELRPLLAAMADAAQVACAAVVAGVGWLLAKRRTIERGVLVTHGVRRTTVAALTAVEVLPAAVLGVLAGWGGGRALVMAWGPSGAVSDAAQSGATTAALVVLLVAVVLMAAASAAAAPVPSVGRVGAFAAVERVLRWEPLVVAFTIATWFAVVSDDGQALRSRSALLLPVLVLLTVASLAVRVLASVLSRVGGQARRDPPRSLTRWLIAGRIRSAVGDAGALVVATAIGVGLVAYGASITSAGRRGVEDKAASIAGAPITINVPWSGAVTGGREGIPSDPPKGWTFVWRFAAVNANARGTVDLMVVDANTFLDAALWRPSFGTARPQQLMRNLASKQSGAIVPIVVAGPGAASVPDSGRIDAGDWSVSFEVIERLETVPGRGDPGRTVVLADAGRLFPLIGRSAPTVFHDGPDHNPDGLFVTALWSSGPVGDVVTALGAIGDRDPQLGGLGHERGRASFVALRAAVPYLQVVGLVALGVAVVAYAVVAARRRDQASAEAVMLGAMGVPVRAQRTAVVMEMGALALLGSGLGLLTVGPLIAFMLPRLDPNPDLQPAFGFGFAGPAAIAAVAAVALSATTAALVLHRRAQRSDPSEVLRGLE